MVTNQRLSFGVGGWGPFCTVHIINYRNRPNYRIRPEWPHYFSCYQLILRYFDTIYICRLIPGPRSDLYIFPKFITTYFSLPTWYMYICAYFLWMEWWSWNHKIKNCELRVFRSVKFTHPFTQCRFSWKREDTKWQLLQKTIYLRGQYCSYDIDSMIEDILTVMANI